MTSCGNNSSFCFCLCYYTVGAYQRFIVLVSTFAYKSRLLITFANSLDPDQVDRKSVLIWIETVLNSSIFLKELLEKVDFEKNHQTTTKKHEKLPSTQRINPGQQCLKTCMHQKKLLHVHYPSQNMYCMMQDRILEIST